MADFAVWATACEGGALLPTGTFMAAYEANRADAIETVPVATAVRALMVRQLIWTGTATELSSALLVAQPADILGMRTWPGSARELSIRLRRAAPSLRLVGIQIEFNREGHRRERKITLKVSAPPSPASASTAVAEIARSGNGLAADLPRTQNPPADATVSCADGTVAGLIRSNPLKTGAADIADDADAKMPLLGGAPCAERDP